MRELIIITSKANIWREYIDNWKFDNKSLTKLLTEGEVVVSAILTEKKEAQNVAH